MSIYPTMKHLFLPVIKTLLIVAAVAVPTAGCHNHSEATEAEADSISSPERVALSATECREPQTFGDSLAWFTGQQQGLALKEFMSLYERREGRPLNIEEFKRGMAECLTMDSTSHAYMLGMQTGVQMASLRSEAQHKGEDLNPEIFYEMVEHYLLSDTLPPASTMESNFAIFQQLYSRLQEKSLRQQDIGAEEEEIASEAVSAD